MRGIVLAAAALLMVASCHLNYGQATTEETTPQGLPDTVAIGLVHKIHKDGRLSLELEAARAETFNADKTTVLTDARFVEYDAQGGKATEGQADKVVFHSDTENAEISGDVHVHSASEKGAVTASSLSWENKSKRLTAPPGEQVHISKDDGSFISGSGFVGDFRTRQLVFTGPVQGSYVSEEKK
ncbi:MAG: LPS export ABC transporter periplasmic protein LptC [Spirochaetia bacterium]